VFGSRDNSSASSFKGEARNQFIARPDDSKDLVVYKWPNNNIPFASLVTVQPDEWAFFVKSGTIIGYLRRGMQRLDGASVPFMKELIGEYTADRVLMAELYFVSTRQFTNNKFGGSMGELADPATSVMVGCGVYGQFAFRVTDPAKLILEFLGTRDMPSNRDIVLTIRDRMLKVTRAIINTKIVDAGWDVLRVTSGAYNTVFEEAILAAMPEQLEDYGLELTAMQDFVVTVLPGDKPKIQEIYDRRAKMRLAEEGSYSEMANAELLLGAAEGLKSQGSAGAGNLAGIGMGVGVGMGLANRLAGSAMTQPSTEPAATVPAGQPTAAVAVTRAAATCAACGSALAPGARFCSDCGTPTSLRMCQTCGHSVASGKFCSACGTAMEG